MIPTIDLNAIFLHPKLFIVVLSCALLYIYLVIMIARKITEKDFDINAQKKARLIRKIAVGVIVISWLWLFNFPTTVEAFFLAHSIASAISILMATCIFLATEVIRPKVAE